MNLVLDYSLTQQSIIKPYTFKDLAMDMISDDFNRDIKTSIDIDAIQNGINNMFVFLQGERILLPDFGNSIYKYLYEPVSDFIAERIGEEVKRMFDKWEPRVTIKAINITPDAENNTYYLQVLYIIPALDKEKLINYSKALNQRR